MIRVGKIVATHGLTGSVIMTHVVGNSLWLKKEQPLYIEMQKGSYIPYFVSQVKASSDKEYLVSLEQIEKIEAAKKLVTKQVYVDETILASYAANSPLLWIGFSVIDQHYGAIGVIDDVVQTGKQWLARIIYQNKEVLIPLIEQTIEKLDLKKKTLFTLLPEGLIEIYLDA